MSDKSGDTFDDKLGEKFGDNFVTNFGDKIITKFIEIFSGSQNSVTKMKCKLSLFQKIW